MFDFSIGEIALFIAVALIVIGPKDLPVLLRTIAKAIKYVRHLAQEFQSHLDEMVKEADLGDAHKELQTLKNFSLRKQVSHWVDPKGTLEASLEEKQILDSSSYDGIPRAPAPPPPPPPGVFGGGEVSVPYNAQQNAQEKEQEKLLESAPSILPPKTAMRLIEEAPHWMRPHFLPPEVALHYGKRVLIVKECDTGMKSTHDNK